MVQSHHRRTVAVSLLITSILLVLSCGMGGSGPSSPPVNGSGQVAVFITDNISFFKQVVTDITGVRIVNSGTGEVCTVMDSPVTFDISNLTNVAQYADLTECPEGGYNRIDIDIRKDVHVMDPLGVASACAFTSFIDENGRVQALACNPGTGICTLSVRGGARNGAFLVQEDRYNDLGIDFDLKKFTITDFGSPSACSVTMAVSLMSAADMNESGRAHGVTGSIAGLDTAADTFALISSGVSLTVNYSGILPSLQPNIDQLLLFAQTEGLSVSALTGGIDIGTGSIAANRIFVKVAGTVSNVNGAPEWSFELGGPPPAKVINVSFKPPADIQGALVDGAWVNVKFVGYDPVEDEYRAASVEVLPVGTIIQY